MGWYQPFIRLDFGTGAGKSGYGLKFNIQLATE